MLGRFIFLLALLVPVQALAQSTILQGGPTTPGHAPMYTSSGSQPVVVDSGPASGGAIGIGMAESLVVARGAGTGPYAAGGTGPYGTVSCIYDGPTTGQYHYLCFSANAQSGALIATGAAGGASAIGLNFIVDGITYPFTGGGGGGGVTSVGLSGGTTGITVSGSPVTSSGTMTLAGTLVVSNGGTGATSFTAGLPLIGAGTSAVTQGTISGSTSVFATVSGAFTNGDCVSINAGNLVAAGGPCTTGGGGGTVSSGTAKQLAYYASTGTTVSGLATANSGVLKTDSSGNPSISTTLPSGLAIPSPALSGTVTGNNTIPLAILVQGAANTMLGNWTGSTANVAANVMPSCPDTGGNHLNYVNGTGVTCGTSGGGSSTITIGTTTIASGTTTRVLYNNAGVAGEYAISGTGSVCMTTSCTMVTPTIGVATATSINGLTITSSTGTLTISNGKTVQFSNSIQFIGTDSTAMTFPSSSASLASLNLQDQTLSGGANLTVTALSTGNIVMDCGKNPGQYISNNGAFSITAPSNDGTCILQIENAGSAGAVTFSGFSQGSNSGDSLDTTNGHKFQVSIIRIHGVSHYLITALQ